MLKARMKCDKETEEKIREYGLKHIRSKKTAWLTIAGAARARADNPLGSLLPETVDEFPTYNSSITSWGPWGGDNQTMFVLTCRETLQSKFYIKFIQ